MRSKNVQFLVLLLLGTPFVSNANNDLRCYVCELENTDACDDPFDSTQVASAVCNSLEYKTRVRIRDDQIENPDEVIKIDGKFRGAPLLNKMFYRNNSEKESFRYVCIKTEVEYDGAQSITRTCEKVPSSVADVCDFVKQEFSKEFTVKNCNSCDTDNCNSGSFLNANFVVILLGVISFTVILYF
ncbi:hypothetical protein FQR65_LT01813 [Abscondita terminalis]|nr:hypothetical protein FQR65_LT01813 [Abscondita terminalis]